MYSPQAAGLKDLIFEVRVKDLKESIQKAMPIGKIGDVYFRVFWMFPDQYRIEVQGLPPGYDELVRDLKNTIKPMLDYVIPNKIESQIENKKLTLVEKAGASVVSVVDPTYTSQASELRLTFSKDMILNELESLSPVGSVKTEMKYSPKSWSQNKLVPDKVTAKSGNSAKKTVVTYDLQYVNVAGFGLPEKIKTKTVVSITVVEKGKAKEVNSEVASEVRFSKYQPNTGKAEQYIKSGR